MKKLIYPVAILAGTIIGVGMFSLPYIASRIGYLPMIVYFLILGGIVMTIHLIFGELSLNTPDYKRLPGFAKFHLGNWAKNIALFSTTIGISGALLAYLIVGGEFLNSLLSPFLGGNELIYSLIYFSLGAGLIFFGIKLIARVEFWSLVLLFSALVAIFIKGNNFIDSNYLIGSIKSFNLESLFLPYGPILFSLWGATLIPEIEEMLGGDKKFLKKIIIISTIIPILLYFFFTYLVLGITGPMTTQSALTGLKNYLGDGIVNMSLFLGVLATFTSFIALGLTLKKIYWYDFKIPKNLSWFLVCFVPLALFLLGFKSFIRTIGLVGGVGLGIDGVLILLMYRSLLIKKGKAKKTLLVFPLILVLILGAIYELIYFLK